MATRALSATITPGLPNEATLLFPTSKLTCAGLELDMDAIGVIRTGVLYVGNSLVMATDTAISFAGTGAATTRNNLGASSGVWPVSVGGTGRSALPKFHAYKGSDQALTATSTTKITFDTEEYDEGSHFASSTFTAPVAGKYLFGAAMQTTGASATQAVYLYKNGSQLKRLSQRAANSGDMLSGCVSVELALNDTIEIYAFTDQNITVTGAATVTYFWGQLTP